MSVEFTIDGGVAIVTLAKPPHNLIDNVMLKGMTDAYARAVKEGCRSILLRSTMRHFCAGADIAAFASDTPLKKETFKALMKELEEVPLPTVAAVHGAALGGGVELALTCDLIVAADTATFGMVEASLGLIPLLGGVQRVVQRIGSARGKELTMLARRHDARTMERFGVVNLVAPEAELAEVSMTWARQLAAGPTVALREIKLLANLSAKDGIDAADERQIDSNNNIWASNDVKRGLEAFMSTGPGTGIFEGN